MKPDPRDEKIAILEEEKRRLEELLHPSDHPLYDGLHLTRGEGYLLATFMKAKNVSSVDRLIRDRDVTPNALVVAVIKLRKKLDALDPPIKILNKYGEGYYMSAEDKALLRGRESR